MNTNKKLCECGCGTEIPEKDERGRSRRFVPGHHNKLKDYTKIDNSHISKYFFKKGYIPWNKGKHPDYVQGKNNYFTTHKFKGIDNFQWKGGISTKEKTERARFTKSKIRKEVLKRDNYTCQMCGKQGGYLHVDHIQSWEEYVELRFSMDNLRTLCVDCHYMITFGKLRPENSTWGIQPYMKKIIIKEVNNVI